MSDDYAQLLHRGSGGSMYTRKARATREAAAGGTERTDELTGSQGKARIADCLDLAVALFWTELSTT